MASPRAGSQPAQGRDVGVAEARRARASSRAIEAVHLADRAVAGEAMDEGDVVGVPLRPSAPG